jgi:DNA-binding XRE family transcriptional regulator
MMKKAPKKLSISRETLHQLEKDEISKVYAAGTTTEVTCAIGTCCPKSSCYC